MLVLGVSAGLIVLLASAPLLAQQNNGSLTGTVFDQAGARLDRAAVTLRNAASSVEIMTRPGDHGDYRFADLPPGKYSLRASASGLCTVQINDVLVQANKTTNINFTLPTADSNPISVVQVSAAPEPVETATTAPPQPPPAPKALAPAPAPPAQPVPILLPQPPPQPTADASNIPVQSPKAILSQIAAIRDRLALSADQQSKIRALFEDRESQIAAIRADNSLALPERREKVRSVRLETDARFRALLTDNQRDEYDEILRERRERALQRQSNSNTR